MIISFNLGGRACPTLPLEALTLEAKKLSVSDSEEDLLGNKCPDYFHDLTGLGSRTPGTPLLSPQRTGHCAAGDVQ